MVLLYQFTVFLATLWLRIAGLFSSRWARILNQRKDAVDVIQAWKQSRTSRKPILCFHCASLGEYEMVVPILSDRRLQDRFDVVVSFFSESGYDHVNVGELVAQKFYLPLDSRSNMRHWVNALQPEVFVFVRYDLWFNLMAALRANNVSTYLVNGRLLRQSFLANWYGQPWRNALNRFKKIFVQDHASQTWLTDNIETEVVLQGDLRFDRVRQRKTQRQSIPWLDDLKSSGNLIIGGSSWPDEEALLQTHLKANSEDKLILAPHDLSEEHLSQIEARFAEHGVVRMTAEKAIQHERVVVLDTIGLLADAYAYADIAVVGGGFRNGLHNVLEALVYGLPVVTGPNIQKDQVAQDMHANELLFVLEPGQQLSDVVARFQDADALKTHQLKCAEWLQGQGSSVEAIVTEFL